MQQKTMTIFTRTPLHVGAGNSVGAIDSPIQRERHTRIPIIPGSSLKGVLANLWVDSENPTNARTDGSDTMKIFGSDDPKAAKAGSLIVGEARVMAFPVRSAKGSFAWVTCPLALARLSRDTGLQLPNIDDDTLDENSCYGSEDLLLKDHVVLEEYRFKSINLAENTAEALASLSSDPVWKKVSTKLVILNDEMFSYFCEQACEVVSRIKVSSITGTVEKGALFNLEQVPSETLFYSILSSDETRMSDTFEKLSKKLDSVKNVIQIGGDASTGLGFCSIDIQNMEA